MPIDRLKALLVSRHSGSRGAIASAELANLSFKTLCRWAEGPEAWDKSGHQLGSQK
jgi:hypothetical protein